MPGTNLGPSLGDPTLVAAFRSALLHQWAIVMAIFVLVLLARAVARGTQAAAHLLRHLVDHRRDPAGPAADG